MHRGLKYGCFGCLGVVGLVVLAAIVVVGVAAMQARSEEIAARSIVHDATAAVSRDVLPGRVKIRMASGGFEVVPAGPGEPLSVEAKYDPASYRLNEQFLERDDGWNYDLEFEQTGGGLMSLLKQLVGGTSPYVTIHLPSDALLDLDFEAYQSGGTVELGGLRLRDAQLRVKQAGFELSVSEPLQAPMETLTIDARMSGVNIERLGNASPRTLGVTCAMAGFMLDLNGAWVADSDISIDVNRGEVNLQLPRDVTVEGLNAADRVAGSRNDELAPPALRFTTSAGKSGEIKVSP